MLTGVTCYRKSKNESIHINGKHAKENIFDRIRKANYFAIIQYSVLDISHTDQISFICRYVVVEDKEVEVRESFLGFITEHWKTAHDIKKMILDRLEKKKLAFKKCWGIGFDNAVCIAGAHSGVQRLLRNINGKAKCVSFSYHSLNLSGVHATPVNTSSITFYIW